MVAPDRQLLTFFGQRLRHARHRANWSQGDLAKRLHVGQDTISHYEHGKFVPGYLTVVQLAHILRVDVTYFFPDSRYTVLSTEEREVVALLSSLPPAVIGYVLTFIEYFGQAQQRQHFLTEHLNDPLDLQKRLITLLERDAKLWEEHFTPKKGQPCLTSVQLLVSLTSLLLMGMDAQLSDNHSDDLVRKLAHHSQRLTLLVKDMLSRSSWPVGS